MSEVLRWALLAVCLMQANTSSATAWLEPVSDMRFVEIPEGCFEMGNPAALDSDLNYRLEQQGFDGVRYADEAPLHRVCVDSFWLGQYEVTAQQWARVMRNGPRDGLGEQPAAGISWQEAVAFAERLTKLSTAGFRYRLPTEAEWEYACRAGRTTETPFYARTDNIDDQSPSNEAWYSVRDHRILKPSEVGVLRANPWGLYDMLGNVWEWTQDGYAADAYLQHSAKNPVHTAARGQHVIRGASYRSEFRDVRCSSRASYFTGKGEPNIGLRLVRF